MRDWRWLKSGLWKHTNTHIPFTASLYLSVSLPPLISIAKTCVISFSSKCCSARPWLGICLRLLLLLQPLHNLNQDETHFDFFHCFSVRSSTAAFLPASPSLTPCYLPPSLLLSSASCSPFTKFHLCALVTRPLAEPFSAAVNNASHSRTRHHTQTRTHMQICIHAHPACRYTNTHTHTHRSNP